MGSSTEGNGKNGILNGAHGGPGVGDHGVDAGIDPVDDSEEQQRTPAEVGEAPPAVAELCAACSRFVASKYKVALDGTPETLSLVDQYVRDARDAVGQRPESIDLVAPAIGAYLGEVMRQEFAGSWFAEGAHEAWRLYFSNVYLAFNPLGMAREALTLADSEGWSAHLTVDPGERELIEQRLAAMPDVDEEEYYLPTTRFDVVNAIVDTLRARAEASGLGDVRYTPDDYD